MKNKKIIISFIVLVIAIFLIGYFSIRYVKEKKSKEEISEYTPQEEIELKEEIKPEVNNSFIKYYDNDEDDDFNLPSLK